MTTVGAAGSRIAFAQHARAPEIWACLVVVAAWSGLALSGDHAADQGHAAHHHPGTNGFDPSSALTMTAWLLMSVAMMGPAALGGITHVARNSLRWRRGRATVEYAGAYLAVWAVTGVVMLRAVDVLPHAPGSWALAAALGAAGVWQVTPAKRRALRACHRSVPLRPWGWAADSSALRFGLLNGAACVGSCWSLMFAMAVAPGGHLVLMAALTVLVTVERYARTPRRASGWGAVALAAASVGTLLATAVATR